MAFALGHSHWASISPWLPLNQSLFNPSGLEGLALTTYRTPAPRPAPVCTCPAEFPASLETVPVPHLPPALIISPNSSTHNESTLWGWGGQHSADIC